MKKIILSIAIATLGIITLNAQDVKYGLIAGFSNNTFQDSGNNTSSVSKNGFFAGMNIDFTLTEKIHIQPSLLFSKVDNSSFIHFTIYV